MKPADVTDTLKPCPFCNGGAELREYDPANPYKLFGLVVDHTPGCFFNLHQGFDDLAARWNTRATPVVKQSLTADVTDTGDAIINGFIIAAYEAGRVAGLEEAAKVADIAASNATNRMNVIRYGAEECEHAKDHLEYAASAIRALKEKNDG